MKLKYLQISTFLICVVFLLNAYTLPEDSIDEFETIAKEYRNYTLFENQTEQIYDSVAYQKFIKWTISLCTTTIQKSPNDHIGFSIKADSFLLSKAKIADSKHGNKIYKLYVKDYDAYISKLIEQPIGQVLVKETRNVHQVDSSEKGKLKLKNQNDLKWYSPTTVSQLFVMKKEKKTDNNDEGWVYCIIDIETRKTQILEKGNISNCIGCHKNTKYDRIFGQSK